MWRNRDAGLCSLRRAYCLSQEGFGRDGGCGVEVAPHPRASLEDPPFSGTSPLQ